MPFVVAYYGVEYVKKLKGLNNWRNRVVKVAKEFASRVNFAGSAKDYLQHKINEYYNDYTGEKPLVLACGENSEKCIMKNEFSIKCLQAFIFDKKASDLEPVIKSEPLPESNNAPVKVAVAKNFQEVVIHNGKDTMLEFYAPWCDHCKKLTPVLDEVAEKLKDEDVWIVKMDATANDVPPPYEVRSYPKLFWLPKNEKSNPQLYTGGREVKDIIEFIAKEATKELKGYDRNGNVKTSKK